MVHAVYSIWQFYKFDKLGYAFIGIDESFARRNLAVPYGFAHKHNIVRGTKSIDSTKISM